MRGGMLEWHRLRIWSSTERQKFGCRSIPMEGEMSSKTLREKFWTGGRRIISSPMIYFVALLGLCAAYLQGGVDKVLDFESAVAEVRNFGLEPAAPMAVATIITELCGSALILIGIFRWLGALWLAGFTLLATLAANRFWELAPASRFMAENQFFEHLGLIGGFLLVAWLDVRAAERHARTDEAPMAAALVSSSDGKARPAIEGPDAFAVPPRGL
jgi:uncharacterized membrane protein YphA (DoxX/SURF4 family)